MYNRHVRPAVRFSGSGSSTRFADWHCFALYDRTWYMYLSQLTLDQETKKGTSTRYEYIYYGTRPCALSYPTSRGSSSS